MCRRGRWRRGGSAAARTASAAVRGMKPPRRPRETYRTGLGSFRQARGEFYRWNPVAETGRAGPGGERRGGRHRQEYQARRHELGRDLGEVQCVAAGVDVGEGEGAPLFGPGEAVWAAEDGGFIAGVVGVVPPAGEVV